ncbi:MAG TPA: GNAT family N-acetyltransferase [Steroidobacteraceae bacterium]|nr:GNAT family N-acetyltransferase [Steroidobacteraceae bacterium]
MTYRIRQARLEDRPALQELIAESARALSAGDYRPEQVEAALRGTFGVDSQLIRDGTYLLAQAGAAIAGCGGWSYRRTLFGGDSGAGRDASELDPRRDPAKIRAFFVHPAHARRGIASLLLEHCEQAARARGFRRIELMATLPGVRLYAARGYQGEAQVSYEIAPGVAIEFVPMSKAL